MLYTSLFDATARIVIYVCIPTHNEAETIGVLLWKTRKAIGEFGRDYRIVVHDDASSDDTAEVLHRYRRSVPLTILSSEKRIGYGRSVEKLLRHVRDEASYPKRDCAVVMQGDFSESPDDVVTLVKILEGGVDIVAGDGTGVEDPDPAVRAVRWASKRFLNKVVSGAPIADPLGGLRAYRVIVLKKALRDRTESDPLTRSDGWAANLELLTALVPYARRISEVPFRRRYDLQARPTRFRPLKTFFELAKLPASKWPPVGPEAA
ncbi:MAG: glycosyltransferase family 2 protein [Longimicrobiales bacterium]|nr:glycosyltransferase family 2 protein [Longimicrobiales bacterium]